MFELKVLIFLALCLSWSHCKLDKYCSVCPNHTMCIYQGIGEQCEQVGEGGVNDKEKDEIVDLHNWMRSLVAAGHETRGVGGGQPKAANMRKLVWDNELQKVAQRWADQCRLEHDSCRNDPRWNVGQNIYWKWKYPNHKVNWTEAIFSWYNEVLEYNPTNVDHYRFESNTGHYTQMIWHDTYAIGCGRRDYGLNKIYVCNYGPTGNWLGEPMYEIGEPCTKCPQGTVCQENLCALTSKKTDSHLNSTVLNWEEGLNARIGNETLNLEKPSKENIKGDTGNKNTQKCSGSTQQENLNQDLNDVLLFSEKQAKTTKKTVEKTEQNEIDLDELTKKEIETLKQQIDELVKNVIKKTKARYSITSTTESPKR